MKVVQKIILIFISLLIVLVLLNYGLNFWVNKQLPKIISSSNSTPYAITYEDLKIDLLSKNIKASKITISPKKKQDSLQKIGLYAAIESIEIIEFKLWDVLFSNRIKANSIVIISPEVFLYKTTKKAIHNSKSLGSAVVKPFQEIILVSKITLYKGSITIIEQQRREPVLTASNLNLEIEGLVITDAILQNKIPFIFKKYTVKANQIYYRINDTYHLKVDDFLATTKNLSLKKFELIPAYSRRKFVAKLDQEKDLFTLRSNLIKVTNLDWGFKNEKIFVKANSVIIDQLMANIYRNKLPADDTRKKPLYSKLLRDLKFPLKIDTLAIQNSILVYEEEINFKKGPGVLSFSDFNLKATHIQSGYQQKKMANLSIAIDCKFMKKSPLKINWSFNVLDKKDRFTMHGLVSNLNTRDLSPFIKPYLNASTDGIFDELRFTIKGNDFNSQQHASLKYHDLKITLYKKRASEKKSTIKSALANLILKNDSEGKTIYTQTTVERVPEKSFFNFLWLNVAAILKQTLL